MEATIGYGAVRLVYFYYTPITLHITVNLYGSTSLIIEKVSIAIQSYFSPGKRGK